MSDCADYDHDCYDERCGEWWCDECQDYHQQNDTCDETGFHPEYCDCSDCRPDLRPVQTITPGELL